MTSIGADRDFFYPKLGNISTPTTSLSQQLTTRTLVDQLLYENYNLKWDEASLEQKVAVLKLETEKQLLHEFALRRAQAQNYCATKAPSQRNRELYKTALCDFWSSGIPCRFGERCWFAHGPNELRIARFVYPGLYPYDYKNRILPPTTLPQHFWNLEQNYPIELVQSTTPTTLTPMSQNVPIGYERLLRRISPVPENIISKNWYPTQQRLSDGDSGIGSAGTNNSPEAVNARYHRPLDTLTNREQTDFPNNEAYNRWLSTGTVQPSSIKLMPSLEQMDWWPDTISSSYPYINQPVQNIPLYHHNIAMRPINGQCFTTYPGQAINKFDA